jgi:quercetin dioxygenase-like cupin family protein
MVLRVHDPEERFELLAGDSATVEPGRAHALRNESGKECVFLLVQGVGEYDFNHVEM